MFKWLNKLVSADKTAAEKNPANGGEAPARPAEEPRGAAAGTALPVSRMLLIDRTAQIIGYEFVLRSGALGAPAGEASNQQAGNQLLVQTVRGMGVDRIAQFRQIWLTVDELGLSVELLDGMPAAATMVLVRPSGRGPASAVEIEQGRALRARGFHLGLAGFADRPGFVEWLPLVEVVALDISAFTPDELESTLAQLHEQRADLKVLARRIDSYEEYEYCVSQGFDLYSGKFLTHRESWPPQPQLAPDRVRLCGLLNDLRAGAELTEVAGGLKLSPQLTFRFLRYINSAGMGTGNRIGSIEQGVLYLGREKLYRWLTLLLFSCDDGQPTDAALLEQALVRGRMMELLAGDGVPHVQLDEMFVTGVFSVLDALLRVPLEQAIRPLQLPVAVAQAIVDGTGPYASALRLVKVSEWSEDAGEPGSKEAQLVADLAGGLGLTVDAVNRLHLDAVDWAHRLQSGPAEADAG